MRIDRIEASKHKRGRVLVFLEDGSLLKVTEQELLTFGLRAGDTLDEETSEDYRVKLIALQGYNQLIHEEGRELLEQIRSQLVSARSTIRGVKGYARARLLQ